MWSGRLTKAIDKQEAWVKELKERRDFWQIIAMSMREEVIAMTETELVKTFLHWVKEIKGYSICKAWEDEDTWGRVMTDIAPVPETNEELAGEFETYMWNLRWSSAS